MSVAYSMECLRFPAATAFGYEVVLVGLVVGNLPATKRADYRRRLSMPGGDVLLRFSRQIQEPLFGVESLKIGCLIGV